jgi:hypothetical protein
MLTLKTPSLRDLLEVRTWRNRQEMAAVLRTEKKTTVWMQIYYWFRVKLGIRCKIKSFYHRKQFIGVAGLDYLCKDSGEITMMINPAHRRKGYGQIMFQMLITKIWPRDVRFLLGECYDCNPGKAFWLKVLNSLVFPFSWDSNIKKKTKQFLGAWYDSFIFRIMRES